MKQDLGKLQQISGNIYMDSHKRVVYIPMGGTVGYIINKEDTSMAELLDKRLLLIVLSVLLSGIFVKWWIALIIGAVITAGIEFYCVKFFLPKQQKIEDLPQLEKKVEPVIEGKAGKYRQKIKDYSIRLIISSIITLCGLLTFKKMTKIQLTILTTSTLLMLFCFVVEIVYMILYYVERKKNKK